jgi:hypothetical protein
MELKPAQARSFKARGLVDASQGAYDAASQRFAEAVQIYRAIGHPYDLALGLESLAQVFSQRNAAEDKARSSETLQEASSIYRQLGAEFELIRISPHTGADEAPR